MTSRDLRRIALGAVIAACLPPACASPARADGGTSPPRTDYVAVAHRRSLALANYAVGAKQEVKAAADRDVATAKAASDAAKDDAVAPAKADYDFAVAKQSFAAADLQAAQDGQKVAQLLVNYDGAATPQEAQDVRRAVDTAVTQAQASEAAADAAAQKVAQASEEREKALRAAADKEAQKAAEAKKLADSTKGTDVKALEVKKNALDAEQASQAANTKAASASDVTTGWKTRPKLETLVGPATLPPGGEIAGGAQSTSGQTPTQQQQVEFATGGRLRYGLNISLLEFNVERPSNEPARLRDYHPNLQLVPPQIGFQFTYEPPEAPWRLKRSDGTDFQLVSAGGMVLVQVDSATQAQGAIAVGATINFFANVIGIGLAVDLYRGLPALGPNGLPGSATAYTGLLAWALSPQGEVTPEDFSLVLTFGLEPIVNALSGVAK